MPEIYMPRLSDTMEEGVISSWTKQVGDKVSTGDVLVEIETDKAVMEYEAYEDGFLVKQAVSEGETVTIGAVIGFIGDSPDAVPDDSGSGEASDSGSGEASDSGSGEASGSGDGAAAGGAEEEAEKAPAEGAGAGSAETEPAPAAQPSSSGEEAARPRSSPLARRLAKEYGLDIERIAGSGPKGRIVRADIETARDQGTASAPAARDEAPAQAPSQASAASAGSAEELRGSEELKVSQMRKTIARRMVESKQEAPHFYLRRTIDAEELKAFRGQINAQLADSGVKISFNDLIVKAAATTLKAHPEVNRSWVDGTLLQHHRINVGVAVALDEGLVVPVLRDTDKASLSDISADTRELAGKARDGKLKPQDMSGGTISVSNLGMFGIDSFSAVINTPESSILAVGAMKPTAVVRDGEVVARNTIALELSVDHRAVDGAVGAAFLRDLAEVMENPMRIIL